MTGIVGTEPVGTVPMGGVTGIVGTEPVGTVPIGGVTGIVGTEPVGTVPIGGVIMPQSQGGQFAVRLVTEVTVIKSFDAYPSMPL
jgi:hypothetical protein